MNNEYTGQAKLLILLNFYLKRAVYKELIDCFLNIGISHDERVCAGNYQEITHALYFRTFHGNLAIVGTGKKQRKNEIKGFIAGNNSKLESNFPQISDETVRGGTQLHASGSIDSQDAESAKFVHKFTALIRGRKHNNTPKVGQGIGIHNLAQNYPAHRVGNEI